MTQISTETGKYTFAWSKSETEMGPIELDSTGLPCQTSMPVQVQKCRNIPALRHLDFVPLHSVHDLQLSGWSQQAPMSIIGIAYCHIGNLIVFPALLAYV